MTLGFAVPSQLAARTRPHCRFVFLRSRVCYALLSTSPRGYVLRFATVAVIGSGWLLSSNKILPMLGTLGQAVSLYQPQRPVASCSNPLVFVAQASAGPLAGPD